MTSKTPMFIDFHKGEEQKKGELVHDRLKSLQSELRTNIYTQNIRLPLIPINKVNPFACYGSSEPHRMDFDTWEEYDERIKKYHDWELMNNK